MRPSKLDQLTALLMGEVPTSQIDKLPPPKRRRPGNIATSVAHADISQTFVPITHDPAPTWEQIVKDGAARAVRCRPPKNAMCSIVNRCPPTAAQLRGRR